MIDPDHRCPGARCPCHAERHRVVPHVEHFVPADRLHGRAVLALVDGPMLATKLAARCGVDDFADVAPRLRLDAEAICVGDDDLLVYLRRESIARVRDAVEALTAPVAMREAA